RAPASAGRRARRQRGAVAAALARPLGRRHPRRDRGAAASARALRRMTRGRALRVALTLAVTGLCVAYLVWRIDIRRTGHILAHARIGYFAAAVLIMGVSVLPMAWRWQQLLR